MVSIIEENERVVEYKFKVVVPINLGRDTIKQNVIARQKFYTDVKLSDNTVSAMGKEWLESIRDILPLQEEFELVSSWTISVNCKPLNNQWVT